MAVKTVSDLNKKLGAWVIEQTAAMQQDLVAGIRNDTPVDTGRARAGWESKETATIGKTGIIKNDVEYIGWLEFGSDTVAPQAMVRSNIRRVTGAR